MRYPHDKGLERPRNARRELLKQAGAAAIVAGAGLSGSPSAQAQGDAAGALPNVPLRMLVGYPAGGGSDIMARILTDGLKKHGGLNVIVDNKAGASGLIAGEVLKASPTDGSVIMFAPSAATAAQKVSRKTMPYDLENDLRPIGLAGITATAFVISPTIDVHDLRGYFDWLKRNPSKNQFGTTALGSNTHIVPMRLGMAAGSPLEPVGYKGAAPLIADISAGHIPAGGGGITDFLTYHRSNRLRILAVSSRERLTSAPELPTMSESGFPQVVYEGWYAFYAPAKMPTELVMAWNRILSDELNNAETRQRLIEVGLEPRASTPDEFAARQKRDITQWTADLKAINYEPQ
ncbi:MAG: tripartite tricarboxylate transporter substrate-binding protein [Burkholderiaceae bacterium]